MYPGHLCLHKNLASKLTGENIYSQSLRAKNQGALGSIKVPPEVVTKPSVTSFRLGSLTGCEGAISNYSQAQSVFWDAGGALRSSLECTRTVNMKEGPQWKPKFLITWVLEGAYSWSHRSLRQRRCRCVNTTCQQSLEQLWKPMPALSALFCVSARTLSPQMVSPV